MGSLYIKHQELPELKHGYYSVSELFGSSYFTKGPIQITRPAFINGVFLDKVYVIVTNVKVGNTSYIVTTTYKITEETLVRLKILNMIKYGSITLPMMIRRKVTFLVKAYAKKMKYPTPDSIGKAIGYAIRSYFDSLCMVNVIISVD